VKAGGAFKKAEWGGAICDVMTPHPSDIVVEGKRGLCGFASSNLDFILRQKGIENVVLGGFLVSACPAGATCWVASWSGWGTCSSISPRAFAP
jgi:nicotinamidase-related amidase